MQVGKMYARGIGVEQNGKKAAKWFVRAAAQGQVGAFYAEAALYDQGVLVPRDEALAFARYPIAINTARSPWIVFACVLCCACRVVSCVMPCSCRAGRMSCGGCSLNYVCCVMVAAVRYTQAMIYEYPKAFRPLADMYYEGRATSKDLEMAKRLYKKAAKNGDELAQKKYHSPLGVPCVVSFVRVLCACCMRWCVCVRQAERVSEAA